MESRKGDFWLLLELWRSAGSGTDAGGLARNPKFNGLLLDSAASNPGRIRTSDQGHSSSGTGLSQVCRNRPEGSSEGSRQTNVTFLPSGCSIVFGGACFACTNAFR